MKVTTNFDIREFVPPAVWKRFGENSIWFVDPWCYEFAQYMKDFLSGEYNEEVVIEINSWHYGGNRRWSCLRTYQYAIDFKARFKISGKEIPSDDIRDLILKNKAIMMAKGLTTIEGSRWAKTWVHADNRPTGLNEILIVGA